MSSAAGSPYGKSRSANTAFERCLKARKIVPFPRARKFVRKELSAAEDDLAEARDRLENFKYKYATINAYYACFHAARALVYFKGFRERSHRCLVVALEALFVEPRLIAGRFPKMLQETMALREVADYSGSYSREGASVSIERAREFIEAARKLIQARS